jgi:hypothetical protein
MSVDATSSVESVGVSNTFFGFRPRPGDKVDAIVLAFRPLSNTIEVTSSSAQTSYRALIINFADMRSSPSINCTKRENEFIIFMFAQEASQMQKTKENCAHSSRFARFKP